MAWAIATESNDLTQGSLVSNVEWGIEGEVPLGVILSNPCDLEHDKASYVLIAGVRRAEATLKDTKEFQSRNLSQNDLSKNQSEKIAKFFASYIHNVDINRYFFFDAEAVLEGSPHLLIDFQRTITIPIDKIEDLEVEGSIPSPFREKMIMHYAAYISRIGVDRIDRDKLGDVCRKLAAPFVFSSDYDFNI